MTMSTAINKNIDPIESAHVNYFDVDAIRADFPAMAVEVNGHPLTFLDSGASAQKSSSATPFAIYSCKPGRGAGWLTLVDDVEL